MRRAGSEQEVTRREQWVCGALSRALGALSWSEGPVLIAE